ncbi:MMPL family transporter [Cerasibacillus terrae]|uniref:MMPL family transporter n=1 Tax=Cerasibacillus terrae TaxID=2498845 RepID=A0A5C8NQE3_9BACI|nr:MMPL family transporter [Cerasibacillus terrae]TXL63959.1 MMPL family transporter [Cerasibacillus terrae]
MKQILRFRWAVVVIWILFAVGLFFLAPNLQELVREKGQITTPEGSPSEQANELLSQMNADHDEDTSSAVIVFHENDKLTGAQVDEVKQTIDRLEKQKDSLAISDILDFREHDEIRSQTVSKDGTTILVPFNVSFKNQEVEQSKEDIYKTLENTSVTHYLTGEDYINQDIITNSEEGLKKTEIITVGLILVILFLVFKSFIAPFIPLLTVGISYLAAQGIVSILADTINFPLSTYTQIFMVAVMFGIGTDYCILMISRFKEELIIHESPQEAVIATYRGAGKTIFYAAIAVLIGFSTIGLSTFSLYKSAVAVAIGVLVVLIALFTLVPVFLMLLGKRLFWPFNKKVEHKESKIWGAAGKFSWTRPGWALLIVLIIVVPAIVSYDGVKSYNNLDEIGDDYLTVKGFNIISDHFGPGQAMPVTVVMETDEKIDSRQDYQAIETISAEINKLDGVDEVRSATRPSGTIIEEFLVDEQTQIAESGLEEATDGLKEIQDGLKEASTEIDSAKPQLNDATDGVDSLMSGTNEARNGVTELKNALSTIQEGIQSGASGAGEVKTNLETITNSLNEIIKNNKELLKGYEAIASGLRDVGSLDINTDQLGDPKDLDEMIGALQIAKDQVDQLYQIAIKENPELQQDKAYNTAYGTAVGNIEGTMEAVELTKKQLQTFQTELGKLGQVGNQLNKEVITPLEKLNSGFKEVINGEEQLLNGLNQLLAGVTELEPGLNEASKAQKQVTKEMSPLADGLSEIYGGQKELKKAFSDMHEELNELTDGLTDGADGLEQVQDGLTELKDFLGDFNSPESQPLVYIPEEALENDDFIDATKIYMNEDKTIIKWDVVLEMNPYSTDALQMVEEVKNKTTEASDESIFKDSDPKLGGVTSTNYDLQNISDEDYTRTAILMLIGIFIILIVLLRSLVMPIYLIGSLVITYITSMAFAEFIFVNLAGFDGLTWAVPFFAFVMLIALGIDYSIFLMDRFREYQDMEIKEGLLKAMKNMGTVIISAAIILGGTFSAMLPSGVLSILQIATVVLTGLFLYAFVILPLFIPIMVRLFGKVNWWPFKK